MIKNIAITGHTRGIGKSLSTVFAKHGCNVVGYSRSTGYDISDPSIRKKIIQECQNFDVFINNAFDVDGQFDLLQEITNSWEGTTKLIINIGSKGVYVPITTTHDAYNKAKRKQHEFIKSRLLKGSPHLLSVVSGLVDTDMSKGWDTKKIDPDELAELIYFLSNSKIQIQEIVLDAAGLDWGETKVFHKYSL